MSDDDVISIRLDSLEESRREQQALNKQIFDTLHRIELSLNQSVAKACPLPGHCKVLEHEQRQKWEGDKLRFERLEKRANENEQWHDDLEAKLDGMRNVLNRGLGGLGLLVVLMPAATWFVVTHLVNK